MKKNWFPKLMIGSVWLWSGFAFAQSEVSPSKVEPKNLGTTAWKSTTAAEVKGEKDSAYLYGSPKPVLSKSAIEQDNAPTSSTGISSQLPAPAVFPAGMKVSTPISGSFIAKTKGADQSFPVSYRQDLVVPQEPAGQHAPDVHLLPPESSESTSLTQDLPEMSAVSSGLNSKQLTHLPTTSREQIRASAGCDSGGDGNCNSSNACEDADRCSGLASRLGNFFRREDANWVVSVNALIFARDYEDDRGLSYNAMGQQLFSTDADFQSLAGVESVLSRRNCSGSGWEARYWGLYPNSYCHSIDGIPGSALSGLANLDFSPAAANVLDVYNAADMHCVTRDNTINNIEFNLLRNGGSYSGLRNRNAYYEFLGGFRWFQFDENFNYAAINSAGPWPSQLDYGIDCKNTLLGFQIGGRTEWCLTDKLRLATGLRGGFFNNRISHHSRIADRLGNEASINGGPFLGESYDFGSTKNDLAFLGEMDIGLIYQFSSRARFNLGYRVLGVSGLALAPNQIPYNFADAADVQRIDSNGGLILNGLYTGAQFCF